MRILFIIILSILFLPEPIDSKLELEDFIFAEQELPDGCKLKQIISNDRLPCNIQTNPFISSDRSFLDCFIRMLHLDSTLGQNVEMGLFSVYEDQSEIGVFGIETGSDKIAKQILNDMVENSPNDNSSELIQSGNILIYLWQDQTKTNSFHEFKKLINARIE